MNLIISKSHKNIFLYIKRLDDFIVIIWCLSDRNEMSAKYEIKGFYGNIFFRSKF